ncbi:MAG TPA: phosphoglycerate mutase family protein [Gemmatimonadales bacterium]
MSACRLLSILAAISCAAAPSLHAQSGRLVILVRHAEAAGEPRSDPPLTAQGAERAEALAATLRDAGVEAVIVSSLARTRLTAEPLLRDRDLRPIEIDVAGGIEAHVRAVASAALAVPDGQTVLVVGHSNTVPAIITALGGPDMPELCHNQFGNLFIVRIRSPASLELIRAHYGVADAASAAECEAPRGGSSPDMVVEPTPFRVRGRPSPGPRGIADEDGPENRRAGGTCPNAADVQD